MLRKLSFTILLSSFLFVGILQPSIAGASASAGSANETKQGGNHQYYFNDWSNYLSKYFQQFIQIDRDLSFEKEQKQNNKPNDNRRPVEEPKKENIDKPVEEIEEDTNKQKEQSTRTIEQLNAFEQQVFELTNQERINQGLAPFEIDLELSRVAREKSNDMLANNYFAHNSPTYGSPFDMMKSYGISYRSAGENIAKGQRTPAEVVNAWMNSPGHRANILDNGFTHIGVGYIEQGSYWTQQFISK